MQFYKLSTVSLHIALKAMFYLLIVRLPIVPVQQCIQVCVSVFIIHLHMPVHVVVHYLIVAVHLN